MIVEQSLFPPFDWPFSTRIFAPFTAKPSLVKINLCNVAQIMVQIQNNPGQPEAKTQRKKRWNILRTSHLDARCLYLSCLHNQHRCQLYDGQTFHLFSLGFRLWTLIHCGGCKQFWNGTKYGKNKTSAPRTDWLLDAEHNIGWRDLLRVTFVRKTVKDRKVDLRRERGRYPTQVKIDMVWWHFKKFFFFLTSTTSVLA